MENYSKEQVGSMTEETFNNLTKEEKRLVGHIKNQIKADLISNQSN